MFSVLQRRHERASGGGELWELNVADPERMLDEFLQTWRSPQASSPAEPRSSGRRPLR
jgi:hypothetical protein